MLLEPVFDPSVITRDCVVRSLACLSHVAKLRNATFMKAVFFVWLFLFATPPFCWANGAVHQSRRSEAGFSFSQLLLHGSRLFFAVMNLDTYRSSWIQGSTDYQW
ncbi:hypothetical protein KIL84_013315 [Mauremys mutica]|uniref:Uncharacterized protein n=1 Tax=Mauremys mutica TaxID=74926 RepID=A0A9D3WXE7_9SAUR|nr:hypothetical protein KIL84_013315 [Mauremys mutica]